MTTTSPSAKESGGATGRLPMESDEPDQDRDDVAVRQQPDVRNARLAAQELHHGTQAASHLPERVRTVLVGGELAGEVLAEDVATPVGEDTAQCEPLVESAEVQLRRDSANGPEVEWPISGKT